MVDDFEDRQLERARAFDKAALAAIYDTFHPKIYGYIYRRVGDVEISRDLTSELFRRFLQTVKQGNGPEQQLQAWLYRSAHNIVIDHYRRQKHRNHLQLDDQLIGQDSELEQITEQQLQIEKLRGAIRTLTAEQQQVVTLKFLEGFSNGEVAAMLDKPIGAVKSLQYRALHSLQRELTAQKEQVLA